MNRKGFIKHFCAKHPQWSETKTAVFLKQILEEIVTVAKTEPIVFKRFGVFKFIQPKKRIVSSPFSKGAVEITPNPRLKFCATKKGKRNVGSNA